MLKRFMKTNQGKLLYRILVSEYRSKPQLELCIKDMTRLQQLFLLYCDAEISKELDNALGETKSRPSSSANDVTYERETNGKHMVDHYHAKLGNSATYEEEVAKLDMLAAMLQSNTTR